MHLLHFSVQYNDVLVFPSIATVFFSFYHHYSARKLYIASRSPSNIIKYDLETKQKTSIYIGNRENDISVFNSDWLVFLERRGGLKAIHPDGGESVKLSHTLECEDFFSIDVMTGE